ncbi:hypothetical protein R1flu_029186 [Riccia fluitans]|uniref:Transglycosylase SLT domain-containing protein n=1 Tax=Riccia fluitans TaxID=41844 RepID=A0ABD1XNT9_9MARC
MGMIGALAWSEVGSHCSGASLREPSRKLVALSLPVSSLAWHRREAAFPKASELNWLPPIRTSLRFSALEVPRATFREDSASEFEGETEGTSSSKWSKLFQIIARALGVGIVAYAFFVLRAQISGSKAPLPWRARYHERIELSGKKLQGAPFFYSIVAGLKKGSLSRMMSTQLRSDPIRNVGKESDRGATSTLYRYATFAEDQDILEVDEQAFEKWLIEVKNTAVKRGIRESLVIEKLHGIRPSKRIMELDSNRPEVKLTLEAYLKNMINAYRVNKGVASFQENELLLAEISSKYGIPSPVLVAIWGIESSYGGYTGTWDILRALLTLAFITEEPRKAQFFRGELLQALQIYQDGHGPQSGGPLRGSWAGAMGQCQFMPSSFQAYAVDYDGDGRKDIWESRADMFASMANYLKIHGWQQGDLIAQKIQLPDDFEENLLGLKEQKPVQEWINKYGVRIDKGQPDVPPEEMASLVAPDGPKGSAFLVFHNFRVIMRYNISSLYSIAVWQLALQIMDGLGSSAPHVPELVSALKC